MEQLIADFPQHLRDAIAIGKRADLPSWTESIQNVVITGLGGSGIGGAIVAQLTSDEIEVPVLVNNTYHLPAFVNENTLVIVCSYSGNTEETISAMEIALESHAEVACITSGGQILELAQEKKLNFIQIPGGNPPRSMLGYSLTQLLFVLRHYGLIGSRLIDQLEQSISLLENQQSAMIEEAKQVAQKLHGKTPVIYAGERFAAVATRFRQQINENSKMLCWTHVLPEMNHNELVGWAGGDDCLSVVILRSDFDYKRTQVRMNISKGVFSKHTPHITEISAKGNNLIAQMLYHIHLEDWVSVHLATLQKIDPVEVNIITHLKGELSKV